MRWSSFNDTIIFSAKVLIDHSWLLCRVTIGKCEVYKDVYFQAGDDPHLFASDDITTSYRHVEENIFCTVTKPLNSVEVFVIPGWMFVFQSSSTLFMT